MVLLNIDKLSDIPLTKQICGQLREKILKKELAAEEKLPSTRRLSGELGISRNRILEAYDQLIAEGYLKSMEGSGTYVAENSSLEKYAEYHFDESFKKTWENSDYSSDAIDFISGSPDLSFFPKSQWLKCIRQALLDEHPSLLDYTGPAGVYDLRATISKLLLRTKGIKCCPDQIIIISGSSEGFLILAKMLGEPFYNALIEDPAYNGIKDILTAMNISLLTVPADENGLDVGLIPEKCNTSFIIVTPSHQFPLGGVLPVQRRIKLIDYARRSNTYIVENDYDGEFRYSGHPISPLYLLDPGCVIYMGTFSESMYPGIRLGYMVLPESLADCCCRVKELLGLQSSSLMQTALSNFIKEGFYELHLSKMKKIYQKKREVLVNCLKDCFKDSVSITGDSTGLYIIAEFAGVNFDSELLKKIKNHGICIYTVEEHSINKGRHSAKIIIGYGSLEIKEIKEGVSRLKEAIFHCI